MRSRIGLGITLALALTVVSCAPETSRPVRNVSPVRHPNIAADQDFCQRAFDRIQRAQQANEWDMNGHAQKAKELISEASEELKLAAESANRRP